MNSLPGLPRACGDRPIVNTPSVIISGSTPRMRGSTPSQPEKPMNTAVYPAHAGIDPGLTSDRCLPRGLPRACGDRPASAYFFALEYRSTPRMRGSTPGVHHHADHSRVYPAHAGIDRMRRRSRSDRPRLPRACGDRPSLNTVCTYPLLSTPRMRGSTFCRLNAACPPPVYPAHAGIDPWPRRQKAPRACLPRACGDRPHASPTNSRAPTSTPRMRGSTLDRRVGDPAGRVYPAHAGIDLFLHQTERGIDRLPRACGDRPNLYTAGTVAVSSTPRMRGSTSCLGQCSCDGGVYPAHAGIDPQYGHGTPSKKGLPRACGDRPQSALLRAIS